MIAAIERQCYDIDELTHCNLHIHLAPYSRCAKPEMMLSDVLRECEKQGYRMIALTNHFHGEHEPIISDTEKIRRAAAVYAPDLSILFGAELSAFGEGIMPDTDEQNACLDYRLYACNHYHVPNWLHPDDRTPRGYAEHCLANTSAVIRSGRADAIAHPLHGSFIYKDSAARDNFVDAYTDDMLYEILSLAKEYDVAWELNKKVVQEYPRFSKRIWHIGREVGTTFVYGSDAHQLRQLDRREAAEILKSNLGSSD